MKKQQQRERLTEQVFVHFPPALAAAVDEHARAQMTTPSAFLRAAVLAALRAEGIEPVARREKEAA